MTEKVTIIVPLYNHEHYICETLASCFGQTYQNIEIIVSDDVSKDNGYEVAQQFARDHGFKAIKFIKNKDNLGSAGNINQAISQASGTYINIINSDDLFTHDRIERFVEAASAHDKEAFCGFSNFDIIAADQNVLSSYGHLRFCKGDIGNFPSVSWAFMRRNFAVSTGNWFFSRALFERVGPFRDYKYCLDWDFFIRCSRLVEPVYLDQVCYRYRIHDANSFMGLSNLAIRETEIVRESFLDHRDADIVNPRFPCQKNYGTLFELLRSNILGLH